MSNVLANIPLKCIGENGMGTKYAEFSCISPTLGKTYFDFEKNYDPYAILVYMQERPMVPIWACIIYVIDIVAGRAYFAKRDPLSWRRALAVWNFGLSLFSWIGIHRPVGAIVHPQQIP